ncbi:MAG: OmpA family protein [Nitrosomonadales bacterium]|nr:OmpA family protein [Nitrosomonadales bacterium]
MRKSLLALALVGSFAGTAAAQDAYWVNSNGDIWHNSRGECWRTINWTEAKAIPECEGGKYAKPVPRPAPKPVAVEPPKPVEAPKPLVVEAPAPPPVVVEAPKPVVVVPVAPVEPPKPVIEKQTISLNAKTMFASGKGELADTSDLDKLVTDLKKVSDLKGVSVEGYTDPMGKPDANDKLSQQRADSVKAYLIKNGIPAEKITASGKGSAKPVVEMSACKGKKGKALSECLAPNRRIEVSIDGTITITR